MMGEPKPLASLSSGLLARKGAARPAMRRQPLGSGPATDHLNQDDLGWNDMGYDVDPAQSADLTPMVNLKPMLTNCLPAAASAAPVGAPPQAAPPVWYNAGVDDEGDDEDSFDPQRSPLAVKPAVVQQQEDLAARVAPVPANAQPPVAAPQSIAAPPAPVAAPIEPEPMFVQTTPEPVAIAEQIAAVVPQAPIRRAPRRASEPKAREKAAFTLRLDAERHLRLRLASAVTHRSAQLIMIDLLDDYLASLPEIDAMASRLPAARANRT